MDAKNGFRITTNADTRATVGTVFFLISQNRSGYGIDTGLCEAWYGNHMESCPWASVKLGKFVIACERFMLSNKSVIKHNADSSIFIKISTWGEANNPKFGCFDIFGHSSFLVKSGLVYCVYHICSRNKKTSNNTIIIMLQNIKQHQTTQLFNQLMLFKKSQKFVLSPIAPLNHLELDRDRPYLDSCATWNGARLGSLGRPRKPERRWFYGLVIGLVCWGKFTGKPHISWENLWFPVDFPLNQSIELVFVWEIYFGKPQEIMAGWWWLEDFIIYVSIWLGTIIPFDELIFFRGVGIPPTRWEHLWFPVKMFPNKPIHWHIRRSDVRFSRAGFTCLHHLTSTMCYS